MKVLMLNQKSGMLFEDIETYVTKTKTYQNNFILFPTDVYLNYCIERGFICGAQNIAQSDEKNQTGELTGKQINNIGAKYVIIGHSERRNNQKEGSDVLVNKFETAINNSLNIVYCIGESLVDYKLGNTSQIVSSQLKEVFNKVKVTGDVKLYIAYEPIWAIGTGLTPTTQEISNVSSVIIDYLKDNHIKIDGILYGGSVNNENIETLLNIENVDGFLIGGASNNYLKTIDICEKVNNSTK